MTTLSLDVTDGFIYADTRAIDNDKYEYTTVKIARWDVNDGVHLIDNDKRIRIIAMGLSGTLVFGMQDNIESMHDVEVMAWFKDNIHMAMLDSSSGLDILALGVDSDGDYVGIRINIGQPYGYAYEIHYENLYEGAGSDIMELLIDKLDCSLPEAMSFVIISKMDDDTGGVVSRNVVGSTELYTYSREDMKILATNALNKLTNSFKHE